MHSLQKGGEMVRIFKNPKIPFIDWRYRAFIISGAIIVIGIISVIAHRGLNYGIDFTGGSLTEIHFDKDISIQDLRTSLSKIGLCEAIIQREKEANYNFLIRSKETKYKGKGIGKGIIETVAKDYPDNSPKILREEMVGAAISKDLQVKAIWVVLLGMIVILIYVSIRFTFRFGAAAVIALFHDVFITIGVLSLCNREFVSSTIAGLLTIIGYSINDSIVISDRVRENLKLMRGKLFPHIVNQSINDTLSRTIITSITTLVVLLALYFFGGRVLRDFALTLLIGVVVGTYSSVFVVAALVVEWERVSPTISRRRRR
jgi:preprotein translocase SecF subunit